MIRIDFNGWVRVIGCVVLASPILAADKNGVAPNAISRPSGPGSLEGLGDSFQPALNTGTARYSVPLIVPPGVAGFSPSLTLSYDSGRGGGIAGMGWSLEVGSIRRQTDEGQPQYFDQPSGKQPMDRFLGVDGEEIVPLANGYFLSKTEGMFTRYRRVGDAWEAHSKNGIKSEYGITDTARISDGTVKKIYRWYMERQTDTHGNVIEHSYVRPDPASRQVYLSEIRYGPGPGPWEHSYSVRLTYEDRPDHWSEYRAGFKVSITKRLKQVDMLYDDSFIRRYVLTYETDPLSSLLTTVTQYGEDGTTALPTTTFGYAVFPLGDPNVHIDASERVIGSIDEPDSVVDSEHVEFIDMNADSLPDLLSTEQEHIAYLNLGVRSVGGVQAVSWGKPLKVAADPADDSVLRLSLSEGNIHLADMTGDGTADWIITESNGARCFANTANSGKVGWAAPRTVFGQNIPAPFASPDGSVQSNDLDFDKKMDIIKSDGGSYLSFIAQDDGFFSELETPAAKYKEKPLRFSDVGVQLADMNGDRLSDVVEVSPNGVVFCPAMGFGLYDRCQEMPLPGEDPGLAPDHIRRAKVSDINGDGLGDLIVERFSGPDLRFWLHLPNGTFARSRLVVGLPATSRSVTRWADLNGNGTVDLIYADSSLPKSKISAVDIGLLIAGSANHNALVSIDNGYGRRMDIVYRSITDYYLDSRAFGNPWAITLPFPMPVVAQLRTSIGLDLDGYPDEGPRGDVYLTDYVYRDGYYDALREQFRGFSFVKEIARGDERFGGNSAPTLVTRHTFHTGAPDGVDNDDNGETDEVGEWNGREEEPLKGVELWRETTAMPDNPLRDGSFAENSAVFERVESTYTVRELCTAQGGALADLLGAGYRALDRYGRTVRLLVPMVSRRTVIERGVAAAKVLETRSDLDPLGNKLYDWNLGDLANPDDDIHAATEYGFNEPAWLMGLPVRDVQRASGPDGSVLSDKRQYYDGAPFVGLSLGQIGARGLLHRTESLISPGPVPALAERSFLRGDPRDPDGTVNELRQRFDAYGNPVVKLDANATLNAQGSPDGSGHERRVEYDSILHKFPVRETIVVGGGLPELFVTAAYHFGFGTPISVSDFNGNVTHYAYDTFGRVTKEILPGDGRATPTRAYSYDLGNPISSIITTAHPREGHATTGGPALEMVSSKYFDGLGRVLGNFDVGGSVMSEVTLYNTRGQPGKVFQPYFGQPLDNDGQWMLPHKNSVAATTTAYDAIGRSLEVVTPPDEYGVTARLTTLYHPLTVVQSDGEDNRAGGPHGGTPTTLVTDGLKRLVEVREIENLSDADSGVFVTKYRYALPDLLAEIEDAKGNIKYMRYDGLGRNIFMNDCDRGHMTYTYDAVGNVLTTMDAKGQRVVYSHDGANRLLTEDYLDDETSLSLQRTPDVAYHYDLPAPADPSLRNTRGMLSWIEDQSGAECRGYDARGNPDAVIKRIDQHDGSSKDYTTTSLADHLGRVYQIIYPDGSVIENRFDVRGLLDRIPGFLDSTSYLASGQPQQMILANGATTGYLYDPRLRLSRLITQSATQVLQDISYSYDQSNNILAMDDGRPFPPGDPRSQTASFVLDNCYRVIRAMGEGYGTIKYDYDRLGNMVSQMSPDIADPAVNLGTLGSGGAAGTFDRIGRHPGDPPGPHALTAADNGTNQKAFDYDANGNMVFQDGDDYEFDFKQRLGAVLREGRHARYLYDYSDRRLIKRVDGIQTSYISRLSEIREGRLLQYVFSGNKRLARFEGPLAPPDSASQRIPLSLGWNLISFQVTPSSTDPSEVLEQLAGTYSAIYGYDGADYSEYVPGGNSNTLTELLPQRGYWIWMSEPAELLLEGPVAEATPIPNQGWMLIGPAGLASTTASEFASLPPGVRVIHAYDGDGLGWRTFDTASPDFLRTLHTVTPGKGYWVVAAATDRQSVEVPLGIVVSATGPPIPPVPSQQFFHPDHLGATHVITDALANLVSETVYYPFGTQRHEFRASKNAIDPHYRFGDKERDEESDLHYFEARYLAAGLSRFITPDPKFANTGMLSPNDLASYLSRPQKSNLYSYVLNNPLKYNDPSGLDEEEGFLDYALKGLSAAADVVAGTAEISARIRATDISKTAEITLEAAERLTSFKFEPAINTAGNILGVLAGVVEGYRFSQDPTPEKGAHLIGTAAIALGAFVSGPGAAIAGAARFAYENTPAPKRIATGVGDIVTNASGNRTLGATAAAGTAVITSVATFGVPQPMMQLLSDLIGAD